MLPGVLRTPEEKFDAVRVDFPFDPKYLLVGGGLRMAYIDEGPPRAKETFLLLHGVPAYSYLYRKMISPLVARGHRVIVPDLIGFGRSDKPQQPKRYTFLAHLGWLTEFVVTLDLRELTYFGHDWGGMLGLGLLVQNEARFARAALGNTHLIVPGNRPPWDLLFPELVGSGGQGVDSFQARRVFSPLENPPQDDDFILPADYNRQDRDELLYSDTEDFDAGKLVQQMCVLGISESTARGYDAPFPSPDYKAGMRRFPMMVPRYSDDECMTVVNDIHRKMRQFTKPFLTIFAPAAPLLDWADKFWQGHVPGARRMPHACIRNSGHFMQEDQGEQVAEVLNSFVASTPQA